MDLSQITISGNLIDASAGTGKTYQLASRFISLLALGVPAAHMIALTFTRKAAGEFLERIITELNKIMLSPVPSRGFVDLQRCGLLELILPEVAALDIEQVQQVKLSFEVGDTVEVISGLFEGYSGTVQAISEDLKNITVLIKRGSRDMPVELESSEVKATAN